MMEIGSFENNNSEMVIKTPKPLINPMKLQSNTKCQSIEYLFTQKKKQKHLSIRKFNNKIITKSRTIGFFSFRFPKV